MYEKTLKKIGLDEKEIRIYIGLLKLNLATVTKISQETRVERTLCYSIINRLIDRGLVSYIIKNNVRYFKAAPPEKFMTDIKETEEELKKILPKLHELMDSGQEKTKVEIYQGTEGMKTVLRDIVRKKKDYIVFGEEGRFQKTLPEFSKHFMKKLEQENVKERVLAREGRKIVKSKNSQFRYVPKEFLSPTSTIVYGNKTAIITWSEPLLTILIENKEVAESYKNYFEMLWKHAKK